MVNIEPEPWILGFRPVKSAGTGPHLRGGVFDRPNRRGTVWDPMAGARPEITGVHGADQIQFTSTSQPGTPSAKRVPGGAAFVSLPYTWAPWRRIWCSIERCGANSCELGKKRHEKREKERRLSTLTLFFARMQDTCVRMRSRTLIHPWDPRRGSLIFGSAAAYLAN